MCSRSSCVTPDRHLPALAALALPDHDDALEEADILDPELHQLGSPGTGLQQGVQYQAGSAALGVSLVEEAQLLFDGQPVDTAALLGRGVQAGSLARGFEHRLALRVVDALTGKDGGNRSGGARWRAWLSLPCPVRSANQWRSRDRVAQSGRPGGGLGRKP